MRKIGKKGKLNLQANNKLKKIFSDKGIYACEVCGSTFGLTFAHRHKRSWYYTHPHLLYSFNQVLLLDLPCHQSIEFSKDKTEALFRRLR